MRQDAYTRAVCPVSTKLLAVLVVGLRVTMVARSTDSGTSSAPSNSIGSSDTRRLPDSGNAETSPSYEVTGVVRSVAPSGAHLVVEHDAIAGLMDAMTMTFAVSDTASTGDMAAVIICGIHRVLRFFQAARLRKHVESGNSYLPS